MHVNQDISRISALFKAEGRHFSGESLVLLYVRQTSARVREAYVSPGDELVSEPQSMHL